MRQRHCQINIHSVIDAQNGFRSILSVFVCVTIDAMLNFNSDGDVKCGQGFYGDYVDWLFLAQEQDESALIEEIIRVNIVFRISSTIAFKILF